LGETVYDCVVPAAGASNRMGAWKPLLPFRPLDPSSEPMPWATIAGRVAATALSAGCRVILVVGHRGGELARAFSGLSGILVVENPLWEKGMLGSIQRALPLVRGEAFFVVPADMPLVPASAYRLLAEARAARGAGLPEAAFFAAFEGRAGHPVLLPSAWIEDIRALDPRGRMRDFLQDREVFLVEACREGILSDIDTPEEYAAAGSGRD
jgi:molybdenum cofactor cytidylyltransferase